MKALVHIGLHKTGTTSIQTTFKKFRSKLAEKGFLYPILNNRNQHWPLYPYFMDNPENYHLLKTIGINSNQTKKWLKERINELDEQISNFNGHTCILSSEAFSLISEHQVSSFKKFLAERFDSVRIIVYIRPAEDIYCSELQQQAKVGVNIFIRFPIPCDKLNKNMAILSKYLKEFSVEQISVIKFSRDCLHKGDVVKDFQNRFLVDKNNAVVELNNVRSNESICGAAGMAIALLSQEEFPRFTDKGENPQWKDLQKAMIELKPSESLPKLSLPQEWRELIKRKHQKEYQWIENTFFDGTRGIFSEPSNTDVSAPLEVTREQFQEWLMSYLTPQAWKEIALHLWRFQSARINKMR
jgi:hypothetical protein